MLKLLFVKEHLLAGAEDKFLSATNAFQGPVTKVHLVPSASPSEGQAKSLSLKSLWCLGSLAQKFFDLLQCGRQHL
jgi:hypothetical protein